MATTKHSPFDIQPMSQEAAIEAVKESESKKRETVISKEEIGLLGDSTVYSAYIAPSMPEKAIIVPVDGSPDSWAALELGMQQALDVNAPGPFKLFIEALAYTWDKVRRQSVWVCGCGRS